MVASRVTGCNVRSIFTLIVIFLAQPALGSQASMPGCFFCANDRCLLAFSFWRPADLLLCICCIAASSAHLLHRSGFCASVASQRLLRICCIAAASVHLLHCSVFCGAASSSVQTSASLHPSSSAPGQQHLPDGSPPQRPRPAISSRWLSAAAPRPAISSRWLSAAAPPASNKPHPAEKIFGLASNLAHLGRIC